MQSAPGTDSPRYATELICLPALSRSISVHHVSAAFRSRLFLPDLVTLSYC